MLSRRGFSGILAFSAVRGQEKTSQMFGGADAYERFMGRWSRLVAPLLIEFADIADTRRVLDVGCGTGSLAFAIAALKPRSQVQGLDPSKEYIAYAVRHNPVGARASFETGDAQQLRFRDATFESSLSLLVFNFIPDPLKALREVVRVTKPGGRIAVAVWDYGRDMRMLRVFWDAATSIDSEADKSDERHMALCRQGELSDLWQRAGLTRVQERPLDITMRFTSFADFWDPFLLGQGPAGSYVRRLDDGRLKGLRDEVKRRLQVSAEDVGFELPARAWGVAGGRR